MRRLSVQMPALAAAWLVTRERKYADHAAAHLRAWFVDGETPDEPQPALLAGHPQQGHRAAASGVIDTLHLVRGARATSACWPSTEACHRADRDGGQASGSGQYLTWMTTPRVRHHRARRQEQPRHLLGAAGGGVRALDRQPGGDRRLPRPLQEDPAARAIRRPTAAFPRSCGGTKPYGYSLFNIDIMSGVCQVLSTPRTTCGPSPARRPRHGQGDGVHLPLHRRQEEVALKPDVMYWKEWPIRHPSLLFGAWPCRDEYLDLWKKLTATPRWTSHPQLPHRQSGV
jgi:hypothetical protein